jgi:type IV pilus assembly protein PilY1
MTIRLQAIKKLTGIPLAVFMILQGGWFAPAAVAQTPPPTLQISDTPSLAAGGGTPNVLLVVDNSNSMDRTSSGAPVLATDPTSKSAIARAAARNIIGSYGSVMNLGLMAYQQTQVQKMYAYKVYSDISFNVSNYNTSSPTNPRKSTRAQLFSSPTSTAYSSNFYYTEALVQEAYMPPYSYDPKNYYLYWPGSIDPNSWYYILTGRQRSNDQLLNLNSAQVNYACRGPAPTYTPFEWPIGKKAPDNWVNPTANSSSPYKTDWSGLYCQQFIDPDSASNTLKVGKYGKWAAAEYLGGYVWWSEQLTKDASYGFLHVPIGRASPGSQQLTDLNTKLKDESTAYGTDNVTFTSAGTGQAYRGISDSNGWKDPTKPLENAGSTPMQGTLQTADTYFTKGLAVGTESAKAAPKPQVSECAKNYVVFLTDGLPSTKAGGNTPTPTPAQLRDGVITATRQLRTDGIPTYFIGFGSEAAGNADLDTFAKEGGTEAALSASNAAELKNAMDSIFADIMAQSSSSYAAVATSTSYLEADSVVYQVAYDSSDWSGDLLAFNMDPKTGEPTTQKWAAKVPAYGFRSIFTYNPSSNKGVIFAWDYLNADQKSALGATLSGVPALGGQKMLNYIAGATTDQGTDSNKYRVRKTLLGDIANSAPVYVGNPRRIYPDSIEIPPNASAKEKAALKEKVSYFKWVDNTKRTPVVYVGANDGMLHAFNADTGGEIFAYIPSAVYGNLPLLASQNYKGLHKYFVDGSPSVADAFIGESWRTILAGGLNAGGKGIYALDVTNLSTMGTNPQPSVSNVLWEFTARDDRDLGYTFSAPSIAKTPSTAWTGEGWVAIFGNGYNNTADDGTGIYSTTGNAVLYVVDLATGAIKAKLDTGRGYAQSSDNKPNGLSTPAAVDVNGDGVVEYVYAGDLQGNLWKFDLSSKDPAQWKIANNGNPLFTAKSAKDQPQPITTRPEVVRHPRGGHMVHFGTGKLFEIGDSALYTPVNTFYGIWDKNSAVSNGRNALQEQKITTETGAKGGYWRLVTNNPVDWSKQSGWYLDLAYPSNAAGVGERVVGNPVLDGERIVFVTITPTKGECSAGGYSWLMEVDAMTGSRLANTPFDLNGDGYFDEKDFLMEQAVAGKREEGFLSAPNIMKGPDEPDPNKRHNLKPFNSDKGGLSVIGESRGLADRRVSWRDNSTQ